jgi:hypothetical protein
MNGKPPLLLLGILALGGLAPRNLAAQLAPVGPEVQVDNTQVGWFPACPRLAVAPDRSFEIAWDYQDSGDQNAYARHYAADGEPIAEAVRIGPLHQGDYHARVDLVTATADGFQALMALDDSPANDPAIPFRQRLDADGEPVGAPEALKKGVRFVVGPAGAPYASQLYIAQFQAVAKNLTIVPAAADGKPRGARIVLNSRPIDAPFPAPILAPLSGGDFVAVWSGVGVAKRGARARQVLRGRIIRQGKPRGEDFDINVTPGSAPGARPVFGDLLAAGDPSTGDFAVVWTIFNSDFSESIHLRFFDSSGRPRTSEIQAVPAASNVRLNAATLDDAGRLLLLWRPPLAGVLRARLFSAASGAPLGPAFQIGRNVDQAACGDAAWAGDSWLLAYRTDGANGQGAIVWRRFAP